MLVLLVNIVGFDGPFRILQFIKGLFSVLIDAETESFCYHTPLDLKQTSYELF